MIIEKSLVLAPGVRYGPGAASVEPRSPRCDFVVSLASLAVLVAGPVAMLV